MAHSPKPPAKTEEAAQAASSVRMFKSSKAMKQRARALLARFHQ